MIRATKEEAAIIRERVPDSHITGTCKLKNKGSKRGKAWLEPNKKVKAILAELRNCDISEITEAD